MAAQCPVSSPMATSRDLDSSALAGRIATLRDELRATIGTVSDPQARAMLETGAEVLGGLRRAFVDYAEGRERAWRP
jgi:hypothetical protein